MGKVYDWAVNTAKEARAIKDAKDNNNGENPKEEQVRALYEKYGGLIREKVGVSNVLGAPEDVAEVTIDKEPVKVIQDAESTLTRRGRQVAAAPEDVA